MVQLVNPVVDLSRAVGGPQPGLAPQGEPSLFSEVLSGGSGENVLLGGAGGDVLPPLINPTVPSDRSRGGGGGGGFITGLASNPLFQAGLAGLSGGNPLQTFQAGIQAQATARQRQFENQLKVRVFQQKQAEFQQQQQKQAQVGALLTQFADEAEAAGDPNAKGFRLAATNLNPQAAQALLASKQGKSKTLTDEEIEAEGLPPDTVAQRDKDGNVKILFNTSVDSQEARIARARATKASEPFVTVRMTDGSTFSARRNDPRVAEAARNGGSVFTQSVQGGTPGDLFGSQAAKGKIETKKFDAINALARMNEVEATFDPSFLTFGTKVDFAALRAKEKLGGTLTPDQQQFVEKFTESKTIALENMNSTLNDLAGAAVSDGEFKRISAGLPNPGTGLFDGDSPTEFASKARTVSKNIRRAIIRFNFATRRGEDPLATGIELADVDALIDRRGGEIKREVKQQNPNLSDSALKQAVLAQLRREFGL